MQKSPSKLTIVLGTLCLMFVLISCEDGRKGIVPAPGRIYLVSTDKESGYVVVDSNSRSSRWTGTFYKDNQTLFAEVKDVSYSSNLFGKYLKTGGKKQRLKSISLYKAPEFEEQPETWSYRDSIYSVSDSLDVEYGKARGYWTSLPGSDDSFLSIYMSQEFRKAKKMLPLTMDVYMPDDGKQALRPLLVLIHGGAFYNGDKASPGFPEWARYFAGRGYVVASVNYRLGFWANPISIERAGFRAVQDVNAAIRYIVHNKDSFYVDPNRVFVAGTSAGGITALNVAFMRNYNIPGSAAGEGAINSVNPSLKDSFTIRAVGNMWGAVHDLSMLENEDTAIISFHSTGDPTVPYGAGHPFQNVMFNDIICNVMYGSGEITPYAIAHGRKAELHEYDMPGRHTLHLDEGVKFNHIYYEIEAGMRDFFSSVMLPHPVYISHTDDSSFFSIDDTDVASASWMLDGGVILESNQKTAKVLLFQDVEHRTLTVCGKYRSGLTFKDSFTI